MTIAGIVGRRLLWLLPVTWGVLTVTFFVSRVLTGDPTSLLLPTDSPPEIRDAMRAKLGLDQPLPEQYFHFLG